MRRRGWSCLELRLRKLPSRSSILLNRGVWVAGIAAREAARRSRPEMAPQGLEKIYSAPGNGMGSEASNLQDLVPGRAVDRATPAGEPRELTSCRKRRLTS